MYYYYYWTPTINVLCITLIVGVHIASYILIQSYFVGDNIIPTRSIQSDLGVAICDNLHLSEHHNNVLSKAYNMLGLVHCTFRANVSTITKTKLYSYLLNPFSSYVLFNPMVSTPNARFYKT